jgi:hypothetical protein
MTQAPKTARRETWVYLAGLRNVRLNLSSIL